MNALDTRNREIANTILNQMGGGRRIQLMTGCKQFFLINNGVGFKVGRKVIKITLNGLDYYDVELGHLYKMNYKIDKIENDVDCEQLKGCVERLTGLYLSL